MGATRAEVSCFERSDGLRLMLSGSRELDGRDWLHVSFSRANRLPSWEDVREVKDVFVGRDRTALQVLPKQSSYVNQMPFCLHLWCCLSAEVTPDFTRGMGSI